MSLDATGFLKTLLGLGSFGTILAFLLIVLYKIKDITGFHDYLMNRKSKAVTEAFDAGIITGKSADYLKESLENSLYKKFEGVNWDKPFREKLLFLREQSDGQITFRKLKRANVFIENIDGAIIIKISCLEKLLFKILFIIGIVIFFAAIMILVLLFLALSIEINSILNLNYNFSETVPIAVLILFFLLSSVSSMKEAQSLKFALEIDKELSKNSQYQSQIEVCNFPALYSSLILNIKQIWKSTKSFFTG